MKTKTKPADRGCVCFRLAHLTAQEVCVAGSFNDWHPSVTRMIALGDGQWAKELALPPGRYEYRFVVDGQWIDDPAATELIPNPFGTANAVLVIAEAGVSEPSPPKSAKSRSHGKTMDESPPRQTRCA